MESSVRSQHLAEQFAAVIRDFEQGAFSSRGLARQVERMAAPDEVKSLGDEMLSHAYWVMRHLIHQPACWAPSSAELAYIYRCLTGEEAFSQDLAESYRD